MMVESRDDSDSPKETDSGTVYVLYRGKKMVASIKRNYWWVQPLIYLAIFAGSTVVGAAVSYGTNRERIESLRERVNLIDEVGSKPVREIEKKLVEVGTIVSQMKEQNTKDHTEIKETMIRIEGKIK